MIRSRKVWWAVAALCALWLLWMTQRPNPEVARELEILTEPAEARGIPPSLLIDVVGNVAVFVPLGGAATLALGRRRPAFRLVVATLLGAGLSAGIEALQASLPTRDPSLRDLALNALGAALGGLVMVFADRVYTQHVQQRTSTDETE